MFYEAVNVTDNALMASVRAGDLAKLAVLFDRHHRALFRYFLSMNRGRNRNRELAEDLVQDVFFRVLRYRASYDSAQSFTGWMYQIARRAHLDRAHKQRGEVVEIDEMPSTAPGPEETAAHEQNLALLQRAMDQLSPDKREILILSRFQEMKYEDIATALGCEVGTVRVRVYRAIRALEQVYFELEKEKAS